MKQNFTMDTIEAIYSWSLVEKEGYNESRTIRKVGNQPVESPQLCSFCGEAIHNHGWIYGTPSKLICPDDFLVQCYDGNSYTISRTECSRILEIMTSNPQYVFSNAGKPLGLLEVLPQPTYLRKIFNRTLEFSPYSLHNKIEEVQKLSISSGIHFKIQETPLVSVINIPEDTLMDITPITIGIARELLKRALEKEDSLKTEFTGIIKEALITYGKNKDLGIIDDILNKLFRSNAS